MADTADTVKTMRLRYPGRCAACGTAVAAGDTAHYVRATKTVRCLPCGTGAHRAPPPSPSSQAGAMVELVEGQLSRPAHCADCGRRLPLGSDAVYDPAGTALCLECVALDTVHVVGTPGDGARREHAKRLGRHQTRVKTRHPRLGPVILALADDPAQVTAWAKGAVGEQELGRRLSAMADEHVKVLHDRKVPRSSANIDHLVVTPQTVWVIDAKRYRGKVETRGGGLLSRQPRELYVGGRNQHKLVDGVRRQVEVVQGIVATASPGRPVAVRGALVFVDAEFGLFAAPVALDGVWIGWGRALRRQLAQETTGALPVADVAKRLAARLRAG